MLFGLFWQLIATLTRVHDWRMTASTQLAPIEQSVCAQWAVPSLFVA
ncbi:MULTISPECIES: hypothetical protein [Halomonadaceae]|uniref:Uncharacterized protein n=2 Tax=Vreelandella TaxID=3137766 RepID=A0A7Z0LX72_9GAMM|nr:MULTISPECIES: hypothetical protein [Halomonas]NYS80231.1 hypothetical protein [Halomonas glaciei]